MELIEKYLQQVVKVNGVYALYIDANNTTAELVHHITDGWREIHQHLEDPPKLVVLDKSWTLKYMEQGEPCNFSTAMQMVSAGKKMCRASVFLADAYCELNYETNQVWMYGERHSQEYVPTQEDILANDWIEFDTSDSTRWQPSQNQSYWDAWAEEGRRTNRRRNGV